MIVISYKLNHDYHRPYPLGATPKCFLKRVEKCENELKR